jgi:hypothetical protein
MKKHQMMRPMMQEYTQQEMPNQNNKPQNNVPSQNSRPQSHYDQNVLFINILEITKKSNTITISRYIL